MPEPVELSRPGRPRDASVHVRAASTALVVAHRLTQAVEADRIVVLDRGREHERGTHDELASAGGAYAAPWAAWTSSRSRSQT